MLQKIHIIWYSFCIECKSFARLFEVKELPFPWSCFSEDEKHLLLISNNEKWLSLKKNFWKVYHHPKCFVWYYRTFFFNYYQLLRSVTLSLKVFHWIIKCTLQHFNMMVDLFILNYPLEYAKRLLTLFQSKLQCRHIGWLKNRALQIHCNLTPLLGTNKLVSKAWKKRDHRGLQKIYVIWYSFCVLRETFEYKQLLFARTRSL